MVVENRIGAGGNIGVEAVFKLYPKMAVKDLRGFTQLLRSRPGDRHRRHQAGVGGAAAFRALTPGGVRGLDPVEGMRRLVCFTGGVWGRHPEFLRLPLSENPHKGRHIRESGSIPRLDNTRWMRSAICSPIRRVRADRLPGGARRGAG